MRRREVALTLGVIAILLFVPFAEANTGSVELTTAYRYESMTNGTFVGWNSVLYMDKLQYALGTDSHLNFTNVSYGSSSNPSWTFGVVSQNGNVNISAIESNYVRFAAVTTASKTLNVTFYYLTLPQEVDVAQPTNVTIPASSYYTTYSSWVSAASPAVYEDSASDFLMVKSTYSSPVIQFDATASTVTLALTCKLNQVGAVAETWSASGASVSPTSGSCTSSGALTSLTANPSSTVTITVQADKTTSRYRFNSSSTTPTSENIPTPASGSKSVTIYNDFQYLLTTGVTSGSGTASPSTEFADYLSTVTIYASQGSSVYYFNGWQGYGTGAYTGGQNPANVTMDGPVTEYASFAYSGGGSACYPDCFTSSSTTSTTIAAREPISLPFSPSTLLLLILVAVIIAAIYVASRRR